MAMVAAVVCMCSLQNTINLPKRSRFGAQRTLFGTAGRTGHELIVGRAQYSYGMNFLPRHFLPLAFTALHLAAAQQTVAVVRGAEPNGNPSSGGYLPPAQSLTQLIKSDRVINEAIMVFIRTSDPSAFRKSITSAAEAGDTGAELFLAEQYIPEQCTREADQDVPHCGKDGNTPPQVVFRSNPLGLEASYEEAARWLQKASVGGSGEASEVLAQLITRMQANGHHTSYTAAGLRSLSYPCAFSGVRCRAN